MTRAFGWATAFSVPPGVAGSAHLRSTTGVGHRIWQIVEVAMWAAALWWCVAETRRRLLYASGIAVLAAILFGFLASRLASRPLAEMTTTANSACTNRRVWCTPRFQVTAAFPAA